MGLWTKQKNRSPFQPFLLPGITFLFILYFGFHLLNGDYGLAAQFRVNKETQKLETELSFLQNKLYTLTHKVSLLKDGSIEQDMLDEYIRRNINYSSSTDLIIVAPPEIEQEMGSR